jgi:hypothetical protein
MLTPALNALTKRTTTLVRALWHGRILAGKPTISVLWSNDGQPSLQVFLPYYVLGYGQHGGDEGVTEAPQRLAALLAKAAGQLGFQGVVMKLVRVRYPYMDAMILAQYLSACFDRPIKQARFLAVIRRLLQQSKTVAGSSDLGLPPHLTMVKVRLSGRLMSERIAPRQTVQVASVGQGGRHTTSAKFEAKNKRGSYTVRVWLSIG